MSTSARTRSSMASRWDASQSRTNASAATGTLIVTSFCPYFAVYRIDKRGIGYDNSAQACVVAAVGGCTLIHHCSRARGCAILPTSWGFRAGATDGSGPCDLAPRRSLLRPGPGGLGIME